LLSEGAAFEGTEKTLTYPNYEGDNNSILLLDSSQSLKTSFQL
jgi:hypothetical protein